MNHLFVHRLCYYTIENLHYKCKWLQDIRLTFGAGGFSCSFNDKELVEFHNQLEREFSFSKENVKEGIRFAGRQEGGKIWVLNKQVQIDDNGNLVPIETSPLVWTPIGGPSIEIGIGKQAAVHNIESTIKLPLESSIILQELLTSMKMLLKHNFIAGKYAMLT